ncbi:MAG TPA: phosphoribosyltransferase family protein [Thermoplasmata archaeon]|nr:phosphoribosyltransferase family protein [Thermoplasmata archaeon]
MVLSDRYEAGRRLLARLRGRIGPDSVVLALPRGGVAVGFPIAWGLKLPLDVLVVRKVGAPGEPEFGVGAVSEGGGVTLDEPTLLELGITRGSIEPAIAQARQEVVRQVALYRGDLPAIPIEGRTAVVVDDGIATGGTIRAAVAVLRERAPERVVLAVGVAPRATAETLRRFADDVVCVEEPSELGAVGEWYADFRPVSDREVQMWLTQARGRRPVDAEPER